MLLVTMAAMVTLCAAAAYAVTIVSTSQGEHLHESDLNDTIYGRGGDDSLDASYFNNDKDVLKGGPGDDHLDALDGDSRDTLDGGDGYDTCYGDKGDEFKRCNEKATEY
jgi:Ca2+-binding RTX toxin-like protein